MLKETKIYKIIMSFFIMIWSFTMTVQATQPASELIFEGVDVSQWQREINFAEVERAEIEIVYIKSSEGVSYIDPYFEENYQKAKESGIKVGFYNYVRARNVEEAEREAQFFSGVISGKEADCKLAMDFESFGDLSVEEINQISEAFLSKTQELTGKELVIYSDAFNAREIFSKELASRYPLWVAEYDVENPSETRWQNWIGFQYTNRGEVAGINGFVDRDDFTKEILLNDTSQIPEGIEKPQESETEQTYIVQRGDTLSYIAIKFNTSVPTLVKLNNIANPNLIFPNQVLIIRSGDINDLNHILYKVKPGDTLTAISRKYGTTIESIVSLNNISNPNLIYTGEILRILISENSSNSN